MIKKPNVIIVTLLCLFVIAEILFLRPNTVETGEDTTTNMFQSIETMVQSEKYNDEVSYTLDGFHFTAVSAETPQWELTAKKAVLYEKSKIVDAHRADIRLFDRDTSETTIRCDLANYKMGSRDLVLTGNVKITFSDGFWIETSKAWYSAATGLLETNQPFHGQSFGDKAAEHEVIEIWGIGFKADRAGPEVSIESGAHVQVRKVGRPDADEIDTRSDFVKIDRYKRRAYFSMMNSNRFVESRHGTLEVKSRRQEVSYESGNDKVKNLTAYDDVVIVETTQGKNRIKYATSQKAEFVTQDDRILLSGFPSVYQEKDTVTGELISYFPKKGLVEVIHSNSFHEGR